MAVPSLKGQIAAAENGTFVTKVKAAILSEALELMEVGSQEEQDTSLLFLNASDDQLQAHAKRFAQFISSLEGFQAGIPVPPRETPTQAEIDRLILEVPDQVIRDSVNESIQLLAGKVKDKAGGRRSA